MGTEGIDATEAAVVAAMLASDNVPDENQSANCLSCGAAMKGLFCVECGQKNDNYRRSIFSLLADLFGSVLSVESRIWRSWLALLFKPGKVAREFSDGRRSYWSSPVRVYLAMSIILFGFMGITQTHLASIDVNVTVKDGIDKPYEALEKPDLQANWNPHFFETQASIDARNKERDFNLLEIYLSETQLTPEQRAALNSEIENTLEEISGLGGAVRGDNKDSADNPDAGDTGQGAPKATETILDPLTSGVSVDENNEINITLGGQRLSSSDGAAFMMSFVKNPAVLTSAFNKWLPRLMFIMMPFTMLLGAIFIRDKKRALLFDHLVHAAYIHAVAFFLLFAGILLSKVITGETVFRAIFVGLLIYLPLSLKTMFRRGWFKTLLTTYTVGLLYVTILLIALTGLIGWDITNSLST